MKEILYLFDFFFYRKKILEILDYVFYFKIFEN